MPGFIGLLLSLFVDFNEGRCFSFVCNIIKMCGLMINLNKTWIYSQYMYISINVFMLCSFLLSHTLMNP